MAVDGGKERIAADGTTQPEKHVHVFSGSGTFYKVPETDGHV